MDRGFVFKVITSIICVYSHGVWAHAPTCRNKPSSPQKPTIHIELNLSRDVNETEAYAAKMFLRLNGVPPSFFDPRFRRATDLISAGQSFQAAQLMMGDSHFLKVRVRNFAIPFINKDFRPKETLTDLQALIIGITRDELDARLILTGNMRYQGYESLRLPAVSRANNDHFAAFEARDFDYDDLQRVDKQWQDVDYASGALTTRAWAAAYYDGGTNRRALKYALETFLCQPIDSWKTRGLPDYFVRRDIDRAPGGDPSKYQNNCRNCHSAMDGFGGAFAKLDFVGGEFQVIRDGVTMKMNKNSQFYPAGFVTTDDSWTNMIVKHPTIDFGWRGPTEGMGISSFAVSLANSRSFGRCMVQKVFAEVCGMSIQQTAPELLEPLASEFESNGFVLKNLFAKVIVLNSCLSHPNTEPL